MDKNKLDEKIEELKKYFSGQPEISMAFLFGSYARGEEHRESDFDIAIYFKPEGNQLEWEETKYYENEDKIWSDVEKIAGVETGLVVLNRAPSTLVLTILQDGVPLDIKDDSLFLRLSLSISSAAEYFRDFSQDYWTIKQRSMSLSPPDKDRLIKILDFLEGELSDYPHFVDITQTIYEQDSAMRRNVERWAENIVNSSIDIAKILLASEKKKMPHTYREVLARLSLIENFEKETAVKLSHFAKLRNILAHEYVDIRFEQINRFVQEAIPSYEELAAFVKKMV